MKSAKVLKFVYIPGGAVLAGVVEIVLEDNTNLRSVTRTAFSTTVSTYLAVVSGSATTVATAPSGPFAIVAGVAVGVATGITVDATMDAIFDTFLWPESAPGAP